MENQYLPNYIAEMRSTVPRTDRKLPEVNNSCMTCDCGCTFYLFSLDVLFYWVFAVYIGSLDVPLFEISFCFWNVLDYIISFEPLWGAHGSCVSGFLNCFTLLSKTVVWRSIPNFLGPRIKGLTFLWVNLSPCFSTKKLPDSENRVSNSKFKKAPNSLQHELYLCSVRCGRKMTFQPFGLMLAPRELCAGSGWPLSLYCLGYPSLSMKCLLV